MTASAPDMTFGLRISDVRIRGFRALRELTVTLDPRITILVGENNTGKTSFLEALATALGHRRARVEDLQHTPNGPVAAFTVDLRIVPLGEEFPEQATQVFGDAVLDVATTAPYVALRARVDLDEARGDVRLTRHYLRGWDGTLDVFQHPRPSEKALDLLAFEMLDARRDILEQLRSRTSLLGRTLAGGGFDPALRTDLEGRLRDLAEVLRTRVDSLSRLREHLQELRAALPSSVRHVEIDPIPQELENIVRAVDVRVDDGTGSFSAGALGMGTRALAALLVFRAFIDITRASVADAPNSASLAAFEEPEAHLHPQAQRAVVRTMRAIPGQVVVSTHSAEVAAQADVAALRVFRHEKNGVTARHFIDSLDPSSEESLKRRRLLMGRNAATLFARAVVVAEGATEAALLPVLADAWWESAGSAHAVGVEFVSLDGARSAKHIAPPLDAWGIPWWLVLDGDPEGKKARQAVETAVGRALTTEVVVLDPKIEQYLLGLPGYLDIVFDVGRAWPDKSIDDWREQLDEQPASKNSVRDYHSAGWKERLALDWLCDKKGTVGAPLARAIVAVQEADGRPRLPPLIRGLFERIDARLGERP